MKAKRLLSVILALIIAFSCICVIPFSFGITSVAAATATTKAIFIGKDMETNRVANAFFPIKLSDYTSVQNGYVTVKLTFKAKMFSGSKPIVGRVTGYSAGNGTNSQTTVENSVSSTAAEQYCKYSSSTGLYEAKIKMYVGSADQTLSNGVCEGITIGNAEHNGNGVSEADFDASFVFSDVKLEVLTSPKVSGQNIAPLINEQTASFNGCYVHRGNNLDTSVASNRMKNHLLSAPLGKWSIDTGSSLVKLVTVPADYTVSTATYSKVAETETSREYYTSTSYADLKFAELPVLNGYEVITDSDKKMAVISANQIGEASSMQKAANLFIPLCLDQYYTGTAEKTAYIKVTAKIRTLSGTGQPMLGLLTAEENETVARPEKSYNLGDATHETGLTQNSYTKSTGAYSGTVKVTLGSKTQTFNNGIDTIVTLGNAEHKASADAVDKASYTTSFAITDLMLDLYDDEMSLMAENLSPDLYSENIDTDYAYYYKAGSGSAKNRSNFERDLSKAPLNKWGVDGAPYLVNEMSVPSGYFTHTSHTFSHKNATSTSREYYSCSCGKKYADAAATELITATVANKKMFVVKAGTDKISNIFIPLNFGGFANAENEYTYFKFTCKMRVYGDTLPIITKYVSSSDGTKTLMAPDSDITEISYDKDTLTYTAVIRIHRDVNAMPYENANFRTGAHTAIAIGNAKRTADSVYGTAYYTSFTLGEPKLYKLLGATADSETTGSNLVPDITDKTTDFTTVYNYGSTNSAENNLLGATADVYGLDGKNSNAVLETPQTTYFNPEIASEKMVRLTGTGNNAAVTAPAYLAPSTKYQLDVDYRAFAGVSPYFAVQTLSGTSFANISTSATSLNETGRRYSVTFTTPSALKTAVDNNFRVTFGTASPAKNNGTTYFSNITVRKVQTSGLGNNVLFNGDFAFGSKTSITSSSVAKQLYNMDGSGALSYDKADLLGVPDGFFEGDGADTYDYALRFRGGDYYEFQFKTNLVANKNYRLSYNYRAVGDKPEIYVQKNGSSSISLTEKSDIENGMYKVTYDFNVGSISAYSDESSNARFRFATGADAYDRYFYIANLRLNEIDSNGNIIGHNMVGDLSCNYTSDKYSTAPIKVTLSQDDETAMKRDAVRGWLGTFNGGSGSDQDVSVVKIPEGFFNYKNFAQRITMVKNVCLNKQDADSNPYFDPNFDGTTNTLDIIRHKKDALRMGGQGGASVEAELLKHEILTSTASTVPTTKVYYVSASGNDSGAGTLASPYATIGKAITKAAAGDTILLKRGDTFRVKRDSDKGFNLPSGVNLGAYGTGDKPKILGSSKNYGGSGNTSLWTKQTGTSNVYKVKLKWSSTKNYDGNQVGNVYLFNSASSNTPDIIGRLVKDGARFSSYSGLSKDGDIFIKTNTNNDGYLYMYCSTNPASKYPRIEIAEKRDVIYLEDGNRDQTIENVCINFAGGHGFNATSVSNVKVLNCEIGYVGGAPNYSENQGNGIQFGLGGTDITVDHCYTYQCLDAGITFQSWHDETVGDTTEFKNVKFTNNLCENNFYNIEFFTTGLEKYKSGASNNTGNGKFTNIEISGNILRFAGYCWSWEQRLSEEGNYRCANICVTKNAWYINTTNMKIQNNIFDCTRGSHVFWSWENVSYFDGKTLPDTHTGVTTGGNSFYQMRGAAQYRAMKYRNESYRYASSQAGFEKAINDSKFDSSPAIIAWISDSK